MEALTFVETYISRVEGGDPLKCELKGSTTTLLLILAQIQQKVKPCDFFISKLTYQNRKKALIWRSGFFRKIKNLEMQNSRTKLERINISRTKLEN